MYFDASKLPQCRVFTLCFNVVPLAHSLVMLTQTKWKSLISGSDPGDGLPDAAAVCSAAFKVCFFCFFSSLNGNVKLLLTADKRSSKLSPSTDKLFKRLNKTGI